MPDVFGPDQHGGSFSILSAAPAAMLGSADQIHGLTRSLALRTAVLADTRGQLAAPCRRSALISLRS